MSKCCKEDEEKSGTVILVFGDDFYNQALKCVDLNKKKNSWTFLSLPFISSPEPLGSQGELIGWP